MQSNPPFVVVVTGSGPLNNFSYDNGIYHTDLFKPSTIPSICISLTEPIPSDYAVTLYFSQQPYTQMQYLGAISNNRPSDIFQTGFSLRPEFSQFESLKLCVKIQHFSELKQLVAVDDGRKEYSRLVVQNLYNFLMSYHKDGLLINGAEQGEYLVIPNDFLVRWLTKFEEKYNKDPNFILKTTTN